MSVKMRCNQNQPAQERLTSCTTSLPVTLPVLVTSTVAVLSRGREQEVSGVQTCASHFADSQDVVVERALALKDLVCALQGAVILVRIVPDLELPVLKGGVACVAGRVQSAEGGR